MAKVNLDQFKNFGIRHGEKVGVALVTAICLVLFWLALSRPVVDLTPGEIESATSSAQSNLNRSQGEETILETIQEQGIVLPGFEKIVDARVPGAADPSKYSLANLMVSPEPGAGLLRDRPELISVAQLQVHTGRGAITIFDVNPQTGEVIYVDPHADDETKKSSERRRKRRRSRASAGMMAGMMPGMESQDPKKKAEAEKARKKQQEELRKSLAGALPPDTGTPEEDVAVRPDGTVPKEVLRGFRWVALTGSLDHKRLRENYAKALKVDLAVANPHYLRVDVERQQRGLDGTWSDWQPVDRQWIENNVLNRLTETDPETNPSTNLSLLKDNVTLTALTDPLPFLEVGYWTGIYPVDLVNPKAFEAPKEPASTGGMMGGMAMMDMNPSMMMQAEMMAGGAGMPMAGGSGMMGSAAMMMGMEGAFGGMFGSSNVMIDTNFEKTDADRVLLRYLDFTVAPDAIYRYRARLVVQNPNWKVQSVMPGVDTETKEIMGPWSDTSETIAVPPDVAAYLVDYAPAAADKRRSDLLSFQMVRWEPDSGVTITKAQNAAPGQIIGEQDYSEVPDLEETKTHRERVDFTSYRVLVDSAGGPRPIDQLKVGVLSYDAPAVALMLRPDGTVILRDEANDATDGEMKEMMEIYAQTLKDAKPEDKKSSTLDDMMMMMPGA